MSRRNVERLRDVYAGLNAGVDDPMLDLLHPEFVYDTREELPGRGSFPKQEFLDRLAELRETFDEIRFEPEEFISSGENVVVVVRGTGVGRASGVPVGGRLFHVWKFENAHASSLGIYSDRDAALESAGLR